MSLHDFVHHKEYGMRAYSQKLSDYLTHATSLAHNNDAVIDCRSKDGVSSAVSDVFIQEAIKRFQQPQYIFSGVQQVI